MIKLNQLQNNLPFIYVPEVNTNFLLDTRSSRSIKNPNFAHKYYSNLRKNRHFNIQTHDISFHGKVAVILFKVNQCHRFYLFNFSEKYDDLVGIDLLEQLEAVLDVENY